MPSRRSHPKTRLGCVQCKRRKIKCDERRPACDRCLKRGTRCTFDHPFLDYVAAPPPSSKVDVKPSGDLDVDTATAGDYRGESCLFASHPSDFTVSSPALDLQTLELMHHFSTATCLTVSGKKHVQQIWQLEVPKVAVSYDWLMHGILSVSALHLARIKTREAHRYLELSMRYQNLAIQSYTPLLARVSPENCHAMFVFSAMIFVSGFACQAAGWREDYLSEALKVFGLLRGAASVTQSQYTWITQGIFGPLAQIHGVDDSELPSDTEPVIEALRTQARASARDHSATDVYTDAISNLELCWTRSTSCPDDYGAYFIFPLQASKHYLSLLGEREPLPLVILAHYAAFLHRIRHYWWMGDWGRRLVESISSELDVSWGPHLQWPLRVVSS